MEVHTNKAIFTKVSFVILFILSTQQAIFAANTFRERITSCGLRLKLALSAIGLYQPKDMKKFLRACFYGENCDALTGHIVTLSENPISDTKGQIANQYLGFFTQSIIKKNKIIGKLKETIETVRAKSIEDPAHFKEYSTFLLTFEDGTTLTIDAHSSSNELIFKKDVTESVNAQLHNFKDKKIQSIHHIHSHPGSEYSQETNDTGLINSIDYNFYLEFSAYFSEIYKKPVPIIGIVVPIGNHLDHALYVTHALADDHQ